MAFSDAPNILPLIYLIRTAIAFDDIDAVELLAYEMQRRLHGRAKVGGPVMIDRQLLLDLLEEVDQEIEQRKQGGNDEDWFQLSVLSARAHAAVRTKPLD